MRVVGGKPDVTGRREAIVVWTVPGGPADIAGIQQGDKVTITLVTHIYFFYILLLIKQICTKISIFKYSCKTIFLQ